MTEFAAADTPVLAPDQNHGSFVAYYLVKKKPDMTYEAFRNYETDIHAPLATALPGLTDYRLIFFPPNEDSAQPFDAMARLTFDTRADHDAALGSEAGQTALADLPNVLDVSAMTMLGATEADAYTSVLHSN